jgi:GTP 3',8-cyclase
MNKYNDNNIWIQNNILAHRDLERITPIHVEIEVSKICNHSCVFCYSNGRRYRIINKTLSRKNNFFPTQRLFKLIDELKENNVKSISLTGSGEPLVYKDIFKVINYITSKGIELGLTSNLSLSLTDKEIKTLKKCSWIRVSINGTKFIYNKIHNPKDNSNFNRVINNIKNLVGNTTINISYIICDENKTQIYNMAKLMMNLKVNSVSFRPAIGYSRNNIKYDKQTIKRLNMAKNLEYNGFLVDIGLNRLNDCKGINIDIKCKILNYICFIDADGNVFPCCILQYNKANSYGNIIRKPFISVWKNRNKKKINMRYCPPCRHTSENICLDLLDNNKVNNFI